MKITKTYNDKKGFFDFDVECEHCGHVKVGYHGYNDGSLNKIVSELTCAKCKESSNSKANTAIVPSGQMFDPDLLEKCTTKKYHYTVSVDTASIDDLHLNTVSREADGVIEVILSKEMAYEDFKKQCANFAKYFNADINVLNKFNQQKMEALNKVFTEEQINEVSQKILEKSIEKIKKEIGGNFYHELDDWIYEHYANAKERIEKELISEITERFIENPMESKYANLREKLFLENKELLTTILTDEAIQRGLESLMLGYTHKDYTFNHLWKDAVVKIILSNWGLFKDDERINDGLIRQINILKAQIVKLQKHIEDDAANKEFLNR